MRTAKFFSGTAARAAASERACALGRGSLAKEARLARAVESVVEGLESRRLFASVSFANGVWTLNADNTAETIFVYRVVETSPATDRIKFQIGLTIWSRDSADITNKVQVLASGGDDTVHVETDSEVANNLTILGLNAKGNDGVHKVVEIQGGDGNDLIYGGDMGDTIHGDAGDDTLSGRGGNDTVYGDTGVDTLHGDDGNDLMYGGSSTGTQNDNDTLWGDDGNDSLFGEGGADNLHTGLGTDSAYGGAGNDHFFSLDSSGDSDYLDGGADSDTLESSDPFDSYVNIEFFT